MKSYTKLLLLGFEGKFVNRPNPAQQIGEYINEIRTPFATELCLLPARSPQEMADYCNPTQAPTTISPYYAKLDKHIRDRIFGSGATHILGLGIALARQTLTLEKGAVGYMQYYGQGPQIPLRPDQPADTWKATTTDTDAIIDACKQQDHVIELWDMRKTEKPAVSCNSALESILTHASIYDRQFTHSPPIEANFLHVPACYDTVWEPLIMYDFDEIQSTGRRDEVAFMDLRDARIGSLAVCYAMTGHKIPPPGSMLYHDLVWEQQHLAKTGAFDPSLWESSSPWSPFGDARVGELYFHDYTYDASTDQVTASPNARAFEITLHGSDKVY